MKNSTIIISSIFTLMASSALAQTSSQDVIDMLGKQGFTKVKTKKTLFGNIRFEATGNGTERLIVLSKDGTIIRDRTEDDDESDDEDDDESDDDSRDESDDDSSDESDDDENDESDDDDSDESDDDDSDESDDDDGDESDDDDSDESDDDDSDESDDDDSDESDDN